MRLEIMLSQNDLLKEGGLGRYINSEKAHQALALRLENILNYLDGHLEKMSRSELKLYLNNMHSLDAPLSQLSSTALTKMLIQSMKPTLKYRFCIIFTRHFRCCWLF